MCFAALGLGCAEEPPVFERCGDGILQNDEYCDDGNSDNTDACTTSCLGPKPIVAPIFANDLGVVTGSWASVRFVMMVT